MTRIMPPPLAVAPLHSAPYRTPATAGEGAASGVPGLIAALGNPEFAGLLFQFMAKRTGAAHMSIINFDDRLLPNVVSAESRDGATVARDAGNVYQRSLLYTHDPTWLSIMERPAGNQTAEGPMLGRLHAGEIASPEYSNGIYDRYGLVERLSLLDQQDGHWYVLNLYRTAAEGSFTEEGVAGLSECAPLVSALVGKQLALDAALPPIATRSAAAFETMVRGATQSLTPRQVQVCARALMGMTNAAIALDLGIQTSTVSTLRKRAYSVLGISSLNDLFARCLVQLRWH